MALQNKSLGKTAKNMQQEVRVLLMELVNMAQQNKSLGKTAKDMQQEVRVILMDLVNMALQNKSMGKTAKDMQQEVKVLLMELVNMALQNKSLGKTAKDMQQEELKTELSKLEQDHSKWKKKSQQIAMSIDDSSITQKEEDKHLKDVANNRKDQTKLLSEALVYRMELEERSLKTLKPELSSEQIKEELSVILLTDLQDQQERDSTAVQNIIQKQQSAEDLNNLKKMQRLSEREGWFNNLSKTLFQLSSQDDDDDDSDESTQEAIEKRKQVLEKEYKEEREAKIQEGIKTELSKLEQDHSKWKKKSQQIAMSIDDSSITQKEEDKHLKDVANNRKDQTKLLSEALVYRMECNGRKITKDFETRVIFRTNKKEELSVILLTDLQDQQERDSTAVQNIIQKQQSAEDLNNLKKMQRLSEREGWFNNLSKTLFQLSSQDDDDDDSDESTQEAIEKRKQVLEKEYKEEREAKNTGRKYILSAMRAKMTGEEIDVQAELKQLEKEQQAKRKALDEELAKQKQALKDKINAKKRKGQEKEEEEIEAYHLLMLQQSQAEKSKEAVDGEKSRQSNKLQDKIRLRKEERMRLKQEAGMPASEEESNSRPSTVDSKGPPPLFSLHREKTVVNVDITEDQKQAVFNKLVREQTSLHDKIKQQQEQQQEMLKRRLDKSRGKKEMQAKEIMDMSERQKKEYHKTKTEERDRQLQQMQQRISKHRARSRSPNNMGASPIPEDQE
ncbi:unnamed protein product [Mytilus coruscus]|uniref:Uncharacterized protein n=1 Tax=Mytilus coruscus TaxID=42192 RepID=A0A6J8E9Q5_MYTCO|nr:unnamed protein product [Mytilus coruscus]